MSGRTVIPARRAVTRFRIVEGEGLLLRQDNAEILVLNETGARIVSLLDGRTSLAELLELLQDDYAVAPDELARDIASFVAELTQRGFLEQRPVPTGLGQA